MIAYGFDTTDWEKTWVTKDNVRITMTRWWQQINTIEEAEYNVKNYKYKDYYVVRTENLNEPVISEYFPDFTNYVVTEERTYSTRNAAMNRVKKILGIQRKQKTKKI